MNGLPIRPEGHITIEEVHRVIGASVLNAEMMRLRMADLEAALMQLTGPAEVPEISDLVEVVDEVPTVVESEKVESSANGKRREPPHVVEDQPTKPAKA